LLCCYYLILYVIHPVYPNEYGKEIIQEFNAIIKSNNEKQKEEIIQGLKDVIDSLSENQIDTDIELD
jgi:hypothetical protein